MTSKNDEGRLAAALEDGEDESHPDSARQHEPRSRGRNRQHGSVDLKRTIGATSARRAGRFEWERALRSESLAAVPGEVKATLFTLATWAGGRPRRSVPQRRDRSRDAS